MKNKVKQVIVIPRSLNMSVGKLAAQAAHASLNAYLVANYKYPDAVKRWWDEGITKIVLGIEDEQALSDLYASLVLGGLHPSIIVDEGRTEIAPGSKTAMAIGPVYSDWIDKYTKHLTLY